jgi:acylphosphatase
MKEVSKRRLGRWILALMIFQAAGVGAEEKPSQAAAVSGIVTGNDQHVGFRAMVMKQAIQYNLAGATKNDPNDIVEFTLQGDPNRINSALRGIAKGTKKSSDIAVKTSQATVDPNLDTFTIVDWTSTSRNITTPYTLVFHLRSKDKVISETDAKDGWREILKTTLKGDDLKNLRRDD